MYSLPFSGSQLTYLRKNGFCGRVVNDWEWTTKKGSKLYIKDDSTKSEGRIRIFKFHTASCIVYYTKMGEG